MCTADVGAVGLDTPSVAAAETADSEEKDDRLTLPTGLGVMEEGERAESGGEENGASFSALEVAMERAGRRSSEPAVDARASESVFTGATAGRPYASPMESSEGGGGSSQVTRLIEGGIPAFSSSDIILFTLYSYINS